MSFLKRYGNLVFAGISLLLLISLFLPWFEVNIFVTSKAYYGYSLGFISVVLILFSLLGIIAGSIQMKRFQGLVETIIGGLSIILMWIGQAVFYSDLTSTLNGFTGGADFSGSQQVSNMLGTTDFGFYVALIAALALILFGGYVIISHKSEQLAPDSIRSIFSHENMKIVRTSVAQVAATVESAALHAGQQTAKSGIWSKLRWQSKSGKTVWIVAGLAVVYGASALIFDSANSSASTIQAFVSAVNSGNASTVASMLDETNPLAPGAVRGFVSYYQQNSDQLQSLLLSLTNGGNSFETNVPNPFGSTPTLVTTNILGFTRYKIQLPEVQLRLKGPNGTEFNIDGHAISANSYVLPAVYSVNAVVNSPLGPVTDKHTEDTTQTGSLQDQFQFQNDMISVSLQGSPNYTGSGTINVNGKPMPWRFVNSSANIGPFPTANNITLKTSFLESWGSFVESGQVQNGQAQLNGDPTAELKLTKTLASVIDKFNKQDVADTNSGNYTPELKYLVPSGPSYQNVKNKSGSVNQQYLGMIVSPILELTQIGSTDQMGVNVNDTEQYSSTSFFGSNGSVDWTYTLEYNPTSKTWSIYDEEQNYNTLSPGGGNLSLK